MNCVSELEPAVLAQAFQPAPTNLQIALAHFNFGQRSVRVYREQVEAIVEQGRVHALAQ